MARKIKFPLKMKDGYDARSIEELREHFDLESVLGYFADGRLQTWLRDRYLDDEAQQVSELDSNDSDLVTKICTILGVEAPVQAVSVNVHEINRYNEKKKLLLEKYPDSELLNNIDAVAFNDDDILQIMEKGIKEIYLIDNEFDFPFERNDRKIVKKDGSPLTSDNIIHLLDCKFIGKGTSLHIDGDTIAVCRALRIQFENINFIFADEDVELRFKSTILNDIDAVLTLANSSYEAKDFNSAYDNYLIAAQLGNPVAQGMLGQMYIRGEGVNRDSIQAAEWYEKAAEQGLASAQYCLATMYSNGEGVTNDKTKAIEWYKEAAEQGHAEAQFELGKLYYEWQVYVKAIEWYKKAAEQGHAEAQFELGCMYSVGEGVEQDNIKFIELLTKAAEQGHAEAQYMLGELYSEGRQAKKTMLKQLNGTKKLLNKGMLRLNMN